MTDPSRKIEPPGDPLRATRDELTRNDVEAAERAERQARRKRLEERLAERLRHLVSFSRGLLAPQKHPPEGSFFTDMARSLLAFNEALREADGEYPRFRILERLRRAARAGVPALDTAASLLLLEPTANPENIAQDLARFQQSRPHDVWVMWLTYILDQLLNSHQPRGRNTVPPDTTRAEWRRAELAFGCVLFSDEVFAALQTSVDRAAGVLDDAMKGGGHEVKNRPPGRVRHLLARFDARALKWYGTDPLSLPLLQPPPAIEAITEPASLRQQLDEVWTAANQLQIALDHWAGWFVTLQERGDAHPAVALSCSEMACRALRVLLTHRPNVEPFDRSDGEALFRMLPPLPSWLVSGPDAPSEGSDAGPPGPPETRWQEDRAFLDRYYRQPEWRVHHASKLRAATTQLIDSLKTFPTTAVSLRRDAAGRDRPGTPRVGDASPAEAAGPLGRPSCAGQASVNPYRQLLDLVQKTYDEELARAAALNGKREGHGEWGPRLRAREAELHALSDAALEVAERTGYGVEEVERRIRALIDPVRALLLWQREAPTLSAEDLVKVKASGAWHDPAADYFQEHSDKLFQAWDAVRALSVRIGAHHTEGEQAVEVAAPAAAPTPAADVGVENTRERPQIDLESQALALLFRFPDLSVADIAAKLCVNRQTLYKWAKFRVAAEKAGKMRPRGPRSGRIRRGHKSKDGTIEAYDD